MKTKWENLNNKVKEILHKSGQKIKKMIRENLDDVAKYKLCKSDQKRK